LGNATQFSYDGGDLVGTTDPLGNTSTRFIDGAGRLLALTDPLGRVTRYSYDPSDQVVQNVDPLHGTTSFSYDPNGNLVRVTNPLGRTTSWTYNNMDHVATRTDPLLRAESYTYDQAGKVVSFTDRKGQVTTYNYDGLNRRTFVGFGTQGSGGNVTYSSTITFQYDAANRMTQAVDSLAGTITHAYDNLDRLTSEVTPQGSISYGYDADGRRTSLTVSGQPSVSYVYDDADRTTQISQGASAVTFSYDDANRRTLMVLPNGVSISYGHDNGSQLTGITYNFGGSALGNLTYAYDALGQRTEMGGSFARTGLPQPLAASYDAANELTNWNTISVSYDANGNMTSDGTNSFTWNPRGQLATLNGNTIQYDALGRRVQNSAGRSLLYDGGNVIQELSGLSVTANLLSGGVDETFTRNDSSGPSTLLRDALGSTLALVDASGNVETTYTYDPFGATSVSGQASTNEFQYTGREDDGNGIYYYRARYYSPVLGRFISEDPSGFNGGLNVYAYAGNSPVSYYDPSGLDPIPAPEGPPPVPVPNGGPDNGWKWNPNPQNSRGGSWGPQEPIPGQSQPSGSWDPEGHWDVDNGLGDRQRYDPDGKPLTPDEAHGKCDNNKPQPQPEAPPVPDPDFMDKMSKITGLTGTALIIYLIVSEGTRLFPPRNLVPVP
jgi:RHS repeat-associated protein